MLTIVAAGGAVGAALRYMTMVGVGSLMGAGFPFGTLAAFLVGMMALRAILA